MPPTDTNDEPQGSSSTLTPMFMPTTTPDKFNRLNNIQKGFISSIRQGQEFGEEGIALTRAVADMCICYSGITTFKPTTRDKGG